MALLIAELENAILSPLILIVNTQISRQWREKNCLSASSRLASQSIDCYNLMAAKRARGKNHVYTKWTLSYVEHWRPPFKQSQISNLNGFRYFTSRCSRFIQMRQRVLTWHSAALDLRRCRLSHSANYHCVRGPTWWRPSKHLRFLCQNTVLMSIWRIERDQQHMIPVILHHL